MDVALSAVEDIITNMVSLTVTVGVVADGPHYAMATIPDGSSFNLDQEVYVRIVASTPRLYIKVKNGSFWDAPGFNQAKVRVRIAYTV